MYFPLYDDDYRPSDRVADDQKKYVSTSEYSFSAFENPLSTRNAIMKMLDEQPINYMYVDPKKVGNTWKIVKKYRKRAKK